MSAQARIVLSVALGLFLTGASSVWAERFLTVAGAQKLCFPTATGFEAHTIRFTSEQITAIKKQSDGRMLNAGNRVWLARAGTNLLGVVLLDYVFGKHEVIEYVVAVSPTGLVQRVEILVYRESYGGEVRNTKWRDQFKNKTAAAPLKLNEDIYNLSGATMSCRHVTAGVKRLLATFELVVRPQLLADGLPKPVAAAPAGKPR